jgi:hypothetical protein
MVRHTSRVNRACITQPAWPHHPYNHPVQPTSKPHMSGRRRVEGTGDRAVNPHSISLRTTPTFHCTPVGKARARVGLPTGSGAGRRGGPW